MGGALHKHIVYIYMISLGVSMTHQGVNMTYQGVSMTHQSVNMTPQDVNMATWHFKVSVSMIHLP